MSFAPDPRRIALPIAALILPLLCAGCVSLALGLGAGPRCEMARDGVLVLRGETDQAMLDCVAARRADPVTNIIVDSPGGPVLPAIEIAEIIAGWDAAIRVYGQCNSSCANYFLPVARRIELAPRAMILLHGSIDDAALARHPDRTTYDRQQRFAEDHGVPRGWLLFRTVEDMRAGGFGAYVAGDDALREPGWRHLLVEEPFLRSCLTRPDVVPFSDTAAQRLRGDARYRARLERQGIRASGAMRCKPSSPMR